MNNYRDYRSGLTPSVLVGGKKKNKTKSMNKLKSKQKTKKLIRCHFLDHHTRKKRKIKVKKRRSTRRKLH